MTPRKATLLALCVFVLLFARSMTRFFDLDEHQFVAPPALLVQQGVFPYADYPYFHMPTLVYIYSTLTIWSPYTLLAARTLSVVCGTATVLLLLLAGWQALAGLPDRWRWLFAGGLALVFMTSRLFTYASGWAWNHDSAVLCMLGALLLHLHGLERGRIAPIVVAGLLLGCAIGIRLSFALAFIPLGMSVCLSQSALSPRQRLTALTLAALAATVVLTPAFVGWLTAPEQFLFGNLSYPGLSTRFYQPTHGGAMTVPGKFYHVAQTFLTDPGNAALAVLAGLALVRCLCSPAVRSSPLRPRIVLTACLLPFLGIGAMGPTPTQYQYYYMLLPFLVLFIVWTVAAERHNLLVLRRWRQAVGVCLVVAAGTGLPRWYWNVIDLPFPERWVPVQVHHLGEWVAAHTPPGGPILTLEPIVPLEGRTPVYPEYAVGRFIMHVSPLMPAPERQRQHMVGRDDLEAMLSQRPPAAVLIHDRTQGWSSAFADYARRHDFQMLSAPGGGYDLWVRPERTVSVAPLASGQAYGGEAQSSHAGTRR